MALIAAATVTILDLATKNTRIVGTVTNDVTLAVFQGEILETIINTGDLAAELERVIDGLFADYQAKRAERIARETLEATWGAAVTSGLQERVDA